MTCTIGLVDGSNVILGSDSYFGDAKLFDLVKTPKISKIGKDIVFGFCGSLGESQEIYEIIKKLRSKTKDIPKDFHIQISNKVRKYFHTNYEKPSLKETGILLGWKGKLYSMEEDFGIYESRHPFICMGAGASVASGAMMALENEEPVKRVLRSLEICHKFSPMVQPPYEIISLK